MGLSSGLAKDSDCFLVYISDHKWLISWPWLNGWIISKNFHNPLNYKELLKGLDLLSYLIESILYWFVLTEKIDQLLKDFWVDLSHIVLPCILDVIVDLLDYVQKLMDVFL